MFPCSLSTEILLLFKELPTQHQEDAQIPKEQEFIVDDDMLDEENSSDDGFEMNLQYDTVCSICDNGGYILWYVVKLHSF